LFGDEQLVPRFFRGIFHGFSQSRVVENSRKKPCHLLRVTEQPLPQKV